VPDSPNPNDVAVSFGGTFSPGAEGPALCEATLTCPAGIVSRSFDPGFSVEGTYAHRLANFRVASLHLELPFLFSPSRNSEFLAPDFFDVLFYAIFAVEVSAAIACLSICKRGRGWGRFKQGSTSDNHGAFQVGGGARLQDKPAAAGFSDRGA
jgi:hypothetical protein